MHLNRYIINLNVYDFLNIINKTDCFQCKLICLCVCFCFVLLVIRFGDVETTTMNYKRDLPFSEFLRRKSVTVPINLKRNSNFVFIESVK